MVSFNSPSNFQESNDGVISSQHITVHAAADATGYNIQYLRRLLRSGALKGVKIGQMWLIEMDVEERRMVNIVRTTFDDQNLASGVSVRQVDIDFQSYCRK